MRIPRFKFLPRLALLLLPLGACFEMTDQPVGDAMVDVPVAFEATDGHDGEARDAAPLALIQREPTPCLSCTNPPLRDAAPPPTVAMIDAGDDDAGVVCPALLADAGVCPVECTGGCEAGVCTIVCSTLQACMLNGVQCPTGWPCRVECSGSLACSLPAQIRCADGPCDVQCTGTGACGAAVVVCGTGPCAVACPTAVTPPTIQCGDSCECAGVCE